MDLMLDLETLATRPDAIILSFGAVKFDPYTDKIGDSLYYRIDVDEQLDLGRYVDDGTIDWWSKQAADVREEAFSIDNRISLEEFTYQLNKFLVGINSIWAQGAVFDAGILEHLYRQLNKPTPWNYWQISDSRTLFKVHGDPREANKEGLHNALEDCISQAKGVQSIFKKCNITKDKR